MARTFVLPDLGEGLVEAEIRNVLVHEGDVVKEDSPLLEVETDKAQVEIPSPFAGRVEKIHVQPGQTVKVGQPLVSFGDASGRAPARPARPARRAGSVAQDRCRAHGDQGCAGGRRRPRCRPRRRRGVLPASWAWIFVPCVAAARAGASPTTTCARRPKAPSTAAPRPRATGARGPGQAAGRRRPRAAAAAEVRAMGAGGAPAALASAPHHRRAHGAVGRADSARDATSTRPTSPISTPSSRGASRRRSSAASR